MAANILFTQDVATPGQMLTKSSPFAELVKVTYEKPFLKALDQDTFVFTLFPRKSTKDAYVRTKFRVGANPSTEFYEELDAISAGVGADGADAPDYAPDSWANFEIPLKMGRINIQFSGLTEAATQASWIDQRAENIRTSLDDFRSGINDALIRFVVFNNNTNADLDDGRLPDAIASVVGDGQSTSQCSTAAQRSPGKMTYGTINRQSGSSWFRSYVLTSGTASVNRPLTIAMMQQVYATLANSPLRGSDPGAMVILTTPSIVDAYGDIADARRRWNVGTRSGKIDLGYSEMEFKGIPIVAPMKWRGTGFASTSTMYFIDKRDWSIPMLVSFETDELAKTAAAPDVTNLVIKSYFNLVCKAPQRQGLICDLSSVY